MLHGVWLVYIIWIAVLYGGSIILIFIGLVYSYTNKQFLFKDYIKTQEIKTNFKRRRIYNIFAISQKKKSIKVYYNTNKPLRLLTFVFAIKKEYFFNSKRESQHSIYSIILHLILLVLISRFLLVYFHEEIGCPYYKKVYKEVNSDRLFYVLLFFTVFNFIYNYLAQIRPNGQYDFIMKKVINYYMNQNKDFDFFKIRGAILTSILIDYLLMHILFLREIYLNIMDKVVRKASLV